MRVWAALRSLSAMKRSTGLPPLVEGCATAAGTDRFRRRFSDARDDHFYRLLANGPFVSSLGLGTYLGECDDGEDARYVATVIAAVENGINLLDTAINYRCQRSERAIGEAVRLLLAKGAIKRDEIVVCTKGGYVPLDRTPPATKEGYRGFLDSEYYGPGIMQPEDVVAGGHCLTPRYLEDQIERSRRNLGMAFIDVYYLHNPEQQLDVLKRAKFLSVIADAFQSLEQQVERGFVGCYGCSTWNGFRVPPGARNHLSLEELITIAKEVGGDEHHFRVIQVPINLAMTEAVRLPTQSVARTLVPLLEASNHFGVAVIGSATLMQSQLAQSLPEELRSAFPGFNTDARRAIAFAQSLPVAAALVGMKSLVHLQQNLERSQVS